MGGTALKHLGFIGRRVSKAEYEDLVLEIKQKYASYFSVFEDILHYKNKQDHGDIDFVGLNVDANLNVKQLFNSKFYSKNSCVHSFDYKEVQIDLAILPNVESFINYYLFSCFSPLGNILGRMIKQKGLKWGINGLTYPIKLSDSEQLGEIQIGKFAYQAFELMLKFMGLKLKPHSSFINFAECFNTQIEIFEWATSSTLFNKDIFALENLNHINRKRDRLRKDYHNWLEFIEDKPNKFVGNADKTVYIEEIDNHFKTQINKEAEILIANYTYKKFLKEKFNGKMVSEWTDLQGQQLGKIIKSYKESIEDFDNFIQLKQSNYIKSHFIEFYKRTVV